MNATNVAPLSASQSVTLVKRAKPVSPDPIRVRFDAFDLDEANALLLRDGTAVDLAPKPFAVLCALARQAGNLVTKHKLLDDVWGHQFVSDSVLKTAVSDVRTALDDDPRQPRCIETVSRRGYRFIAATTSTSTPASLRGNLRRMDCMEQASSIGLADVLSKRCSLWDVACRDGVVIGDVRSAAASSHDTGCGCAIPPPVFPTVEEVRYARALKLQLRARFLGDPAQLGMA